MKKKLEKMFTSPVFTVTAFALAAVLLITSAVGGARAARTIESDTYAAQVEMQDIGVQLLENGDVVAQRIHVESGDDGLGTAINQTKKDISSTGYLLTGINEKDFKIGVTYKEELTFRNPVQQDRKAINEYLRVTVRKYWAEGNTTTDEEGNVTDVTITKKRRDLDPGLIELHFVGTPATGWQEEVDPTIPDPDGDVENNERRVFYYTNVLAPGDETTPLTDYIRINGDIAHMVDQDIVSTTEDGYTVFTTTYVYDGMFFCLECEVDAVQDHSAEKAARSAWGRWR